MTPSLEPSRAVPSAKEEIVKLEMRVRHETFMVHTHIYRPEGKGPFPAVIFAHGRPIDPTRRRDMNAIPGQHFNYWLKKGVAVLAPMRPGYGKTGGSDIEGCGPLPEESAFDKTIPRSAYQANLGRDTLMKTYAWARSQPWIYPERILFEGQSKGGLACMAVAARNLPGVVGVVSFAGGTGATTKPGKSVNVKEVTEVFREFGKEAKGPSLWLYAKNDLSWGERVPVKWHAAFSKGGSNAAFEQLAAPPKDDKGFPVDGHHVLRFAPQLWKDPLDKFVDSVGLLTKPGDASGPS